MATTYKTFLNNDIASTRTLLHEAIPITGTIASGTYEDENIKNYAHGIFQSVYDYPYLSSSANHIFDITAGYASDSSLSASTNSQNSKKINVYNEMAQVLVPYDVTGNIQNFDVDGNIIAGGGKFRDCFFLNFARLLSKDEIKKGSFTATFLTGGHPEAPTNALTISDYGAATSFKINSPTGEYGLLLTASGDDASNAVGHIYYQAGIAVLTGALFSNRMVGVNAPEAPSHYCGFSGNDGAGPGVTGSFAMYLTGSTIKKVCNGVRNRLQSVEFNNTTELNSTIYFARANTGDFNYSANPTYLSQSKIQVKGDNPFAEPVSYITTVGMYSADNELLAVAKLSEPLKKTPSNELTLRVRLDY